MKRFLLMVFCIFLLLTACNLPGNAPEPTTDPGLVATLVQATLDAFGTPTPVIQPTQELPTVAPTDTPAPAQSKAAGKVCYPDGREDSALRAFFQRTDGKVTEMAISAYVASYEVVLEPGEYIAYAWLQDFSLGGMYSDGKTPKQFTIANGITTFEIDLCDWSNGPFDVPYPPGYTPAQTTGQISGSISYPYGSIPGMTLVAFNQGTGNWYYVMTGDGQAYFSFSEMPPGKYQVVAYDGTHSGGSAIVTVEAGKTATADITDWSGSYPSNPVK